jgi:DNA-binding transcriptional LysR family regulator
MPRYIPYPESITDAAACETHILRITDNQLVVCAFLRVYNLVMVSDAKIKCFLAAASTESFSAAAAKLYISQQAVSKHISDLEKDFGVRLFMRDRRHVSLTSEGRRAAEWFSAQEAAYETFLAELRGPGGAPMASEIRAGYQNWMDFGKAPTHALEKLKKDYPGIVLSAERYAPSGLLEKLAEGNLDMILIHQRFISGKAPELVSVSLFDTPISLVCSEDNQTLTTAKSFADFFGSPMLIDRLDGESDNDAVARAAAEAKRFGFEPGEIMVVPNRDSVYEEAGLDRGIFFGSDRTLVPESAHLVKFPTGRSDTICAIRLRSNKKRRVTRFIERLCEEYGQA